jgi:hypothetical protein
MSKRGIAAMTYRAPVNEMLFMTRPGRLDRAILDGID